MSRPVAVAALVCDGLVTVETTDQFKYTRTVTHCKADCEASAPILGDGPVALEQAHRVARRNACVLAESLGWAVAPHGYERDLCPQCRGVK